MTDTREIWVWTVYLTGVGVARKSDIRPDGTARFAMFPSMDDAAGYVLDQGGTFAHSRRVA